MDTQYANKATQTDSPAQPTEVSSHLQEIRYEAEEVLKLANALEGRFDRVLRSKVPQADGSSTSKASSPLTSLGGELEQVRGLHRAAIETLRGILDRAEL